MSIDSPNEQLFLTAEPRGLHDVSLPSRHVACTRKYFKSIEKYLSRFFELTLSFSLFVFLLE